MSENKAEKSLRWLVNQIPDFEPKTNEEKMLLNIKFYCNAGANEIVRLTAENAKLRETLSKMETVEKELRERLEKAEKAFCLVCWEIAVLDVCCMGCENEDNCRIMFFNGGYKLKASECKNCWLKKAESRLAEMKGGKK